MTTRYSAAGAEKTRERRITKGERSRKIQGKLKVLIEQKLKLSSSSEQISGRLRLELGVSISHETIYPHVLRDTQNRGWLRGYKHHLFKKSRMAERTCERKNWIEQRPAETDARSEIGHCVVGTEVVPCC